MPEQAGRQKKGEGRFGVKDCVAEIRLAGLHSFFKRSLPQSHLPVVDLSEEGMQLLTRDTIEEGSKLSITLDIPAFDEPISVEGTVRWIKTAKAGTKIRRIGIQFGRLNTKTKKKLQTLKDDEFLQSVNRFKNW